MKNQYLSDKEWREYREKAHKERSLAFHASMKAVGRSVKNLFSQPERLISAAGKKPCHNTKDCPAL